MQRDLAVLPLMQGQRDLVVLPLMQGERDLAVLPQLACKKRPEKIKI